MGEAVGYRPEILIRLLIGRTVGHPQLIPKGWLVGFFVGKTVGRVVGFTVGIFGWCRSRWYRNISSWIHRRPCKERRQTF